MSSSKRISSAIEDSFLSKVRIHNNRIKTNNLDGWLTTVSSPEHHNHIQSRVSNLGLDIEILDRRSKLGKYGAMSMSIQEIASLENLPWFKTIDSNDRISLTRVIYDNPSCQRALIVQGSCGCGQASIYGKQISQLSKDGWKLRGRNENSKPEDKSLTVLRTFNHNDQFLSEYDLVVFPKNSTNKERLKKLFWETIKNGDGDTKVFAYCVDRNRKDEAHTGMQRKFINRCFSEPMLIPYVPTGTRGKQKPKKPGSLRVPSEANDRTKNILDRPSLLSAALLLYFEENFEAANKACLRLTNQGLFLWDAERPRPRMGMLDMFYNDVVDLLKKE